MMFKLDDYFNKTRMKYIVADWLMNNATIKDKTKFLSNFGISYNTFRVEKSRDRVKNDNADRILEYFGFNELDNSKKLIYEKTINKMYYGVYFREYEKIKEYILLLDEFIAENNYLKPLFVLFKIFGKMNIGIDINEINELTLLDVEYINHFKKNYFINEYKMIFEAINHTIKREDNINKLSSLVQDYPELKWLYLSFVGSIHYMNENDHDALRIYRELVSILKLHKNSERLMIAYVNMCFSINRLKSYNECIELTKDCLSNIYSSKNGIWIKNLLMHYLFASYMIERYDDVVECYSNILFKIEKLNWVSASICVLSAFKLNKLDGVQFIIDNFKEDENFKLIMKYIQTNDKSNLTNLKQTPMIMDIVSKLGK